MEKMCTGIFDKSRPCDQVVENKTSEGPGLVRIINKMAMVTRYGHKIAYFPHHTRYDVYGLSWNFEWIEFVEGDSAQRIPFQKSRKRELVAELETTRTIDCLTAVILTSWQVVTFSFPIGEVKMHSESAISTLITVWWCAFILLELDPSAETPISSNDLE